MKRHEFSSGFAKDIEAYIEHKKSCGFNPESFRSELIAFDKFCASRGIKEAVLTKQDIDAWTEKRTGESDINRYKRVCALRRFLRFLMRLGRAVPPIQSPKPVKSDFRPYIYNDAEVARYFKAVDEFQDGNARNGLQYPVLFRILYCCGTRLGETLSIKKKDIDFENGLIYLRKTKGKKERIIPVGEDLKNLLAQFREMCLQNLDDNDLVFTTSRGSRIDQKIIYEHHRLFLLQAGIAYQGGGNGPRIHDWRHHMGVYSFRGMSDSGLDMYTTLPILSAYMGHRDIYSTETYIRLALQHFPELEKKFGKRIREIFGGPDNENH